MRQKTIRNITLKEQDFGDKKDAVIRLAESLNGVKSFVTITDSEPPTAWFEFYWDDKLIPTHERFIEVKEKLEAAGARPQAEEVFETVIFPPEHVFVPDMYSTELANIGEIELSDWMQSDNVDEAYRLIIRGAFYPRSGKLLVYRISPKQLVLVWEIRDQYLDIHYHNDLKGFKVPSATGTIQKVLDEQTWSNFCQLLHYEDFWGNTEWRDRSRIVMDGVSYIFEGWRESLYKYRQHWNEPPYERVHDFLQDILNVES